MGTLRRCYGFYLLLAMLVAAGSVAAAGQQGAMRGATSTLQASTNAVAGGSGDVFATPFNIVALANPVGWQEAPPSVSTAESGEAPIGGPSPSEWAASEQGTGEAARRAVRSAALGAAHAAGLDWPEPELSRLCVYRL